MEIICSALIILGSAFLVKLLNTSSHCEEPWAFWFIGLMAGMLATAINF